MVLEAPTPLGTQIQKNNLIGKYCSTYGGNNGRDQQVRKYTMSNNTETLMMAFSNRVI
jgi:hypothetical protein